MSKEIVRELVNGEWTTTVGDSAGGGGSQPGVAVWTGPFKIGVFDDVYVSAATGATGGDFTLTVNGETTVAVGFDAEQAAIQAALEALPSVGAGNVTVTVFGTNLSDGDAQVVFSASIATDLLTVDAAGLSGPGSPYTISPTASSTVAVPLVTLQEGDVLDEFLWSSVTPFAEGGSLGFTDDPDHAPASSRQPAWGTPVFEGSWVELDLASSGVFTNFTGSNGGGPTQMPTVTQALWAAAAVAAATNPGEPESFSEQSQLPAAALGEVLVYAYVDNIDPNPSEGEVWIWIKTATPAA